MQIVEKILETGKYKKKIFKTIEDPRVVIKHTKYFSAIDLHGHMLKQCSAALIVSSLVTIIAINVRDNINK